MYSDPTGHLPFFAITAAIGAALGLVVGGVKAAKAGKSVWKGALKGAAVGGLVGLGAGAAAEAISGITKNPTRIYDNLVSGAKYRIPDCLTSTTLSEVKNYSGTLSYTAQLRDFVSYSQAHGLQMHLYTNAKLSGRLQEIVDSDIIQVFPLK